MIKSSFDVLDRVCPRCRHLTLLGIYLENEDRNHQHTFYYCRFYARGTTQQCGWTGWTIPPLVQTALPVSSLFPGANVMWNQQWNYVREIRRHAMTQEDNTVWVFFCDNPDPVRMNLNTTVVVDTTIY